jgi:hypothetical protein
MPTRPRSYGLTLRQKRAHVPKLPGTADRGASLPAPDWAKRYRMVRVGTNADGTPVIEARQKPWPT